MQFSRILNLFERHPDTIFRKIKGKSIILNYKTGKFIELNETGYFIWKKLPSQSPQIINDLAQASKKPKEEIKKDVLNFLESLRRNNFVIKNKRIPLVKAVNELTLREKIKAIGIKLCVPIIAEIELLYQCNLNCLHCFNITERKRKNTLNTASWKNIIDQLFNIGTIYLVLTGGEIFLRKDLYELIEYAHKKDFLIRLLANGTFITEMDAQKLKKFRITSIQISLYSHIPEIHDSVTGVKGSFKKSMKAIKILLRNGIYVEIATPLMKINFQSCKGIKQLAKKIGIRARLSYPIFERNNGSKDVYNLRPSRNQIIEFFLKNPEQIVCEARKRNEPICGSGINTCQINPFGDIFPCTLLNMKLGNVKNQSLRKIWNYSPFLNYLRKLKIKSLTKCYKCPAISYCNVCPGLNMKATNNILVPAKVCCDYAFSAKEAQSKIYKKLT